MKESVYKIIKEENGATIDTIAIKLGLSVSKVTKIVEKEVSRGFLEERGGKYYVKIFLMPPVQKPAEGIAWDFGRIQKAAAEIPTEYMNPYNDKIAPRQQGGRETCVGQSSSAMMDYCHVMLTKEEPTGVIRRDIADGKTLRDELYDQSFSAQAIYDWSRKEGNVTAPKGSYCSAAIKALNKKGICLEKQWYTSKDSAGVWTTPFPATLQECEAEAAKHRLEGYAVIRSASELKTCLATRGVALGAINIYANYLANGKVVEDGLEVYDGNLPDIVGEVIGSHALVFIGYSDSKQRFYFRHSWKEFTKIGSISYKYWEQAGGDFWAPLDTEESVIGRKVYQTVRVTVAPQEASACTVLTVNGAQRPEKPPADIALERGTPATIGVTAAGFLAQVREIKTVDESVTLVAFTLETESVPAVPLWMRILDWIVKVIFKR